MNVVRVAGWCLAAALLVACGGDDSAADRAPTSSLATPERDALPVEGSDDVTEAVDEAADGDGLFPDVLAVDATFDEQGGTWSFAVTLSSPYDTADRYADAWRVLGPNDEELGVRVLTHDHADEQPFTRRLNGVEIPADVTEVTVEGRDQINGYGGATVTIELARS